MKQSDLDILSSTIKDIRNFSNKLEYDTSSYINEKLNDISPIIDSEYKKLDNTLDTTCPMIKLVSYKDCNTNDLPFDFTNPDIISFTINKVMSQLVSEGYKIYDYGLFVKDLTVAYIKYGY